MNEDWEKKYKELEKWYFNTSLISHLFASIPNKGDEEYRLFDGAFFELRCGTYSSGCYEKFKEYVFANADKEKLERLKDKIDW